MAGVKNFWGDMKASFESLKWYEWEMIGIVVAIAGYSMVHAFLRPSASGNPPWLTVLNFISGICGVLCIFFTAKASRSNFLFAIVNTMVYIIYLLYWKIYGTMFLELLVYLPMNFISWYIWTKNKDGKENRLAKTRRLEASPGWMPSHWPLDSWPSFWKLSAIGNSTSGGLLRISWLS